MKKTRRKTNKVSGDISVVVMGVSGSGKTTVGSALAVATNAEFCDGDDLHPAENIQKMAAGLSLSDEERAPWLNRVGEKLQAEQSAGHNVVMACSALKHAYREIIRGYVPNVVFVFLDGTKDILEQRLSSRQHAFMPASLLVSQLNTLEPLLPSEEGIRVDINLNPSEAVSSVIEHLKRDAVDSAAYRMNR